ncbi:hypothetical protein [Streptomyces sp. NPDC001843]|uniref:hypothetical protein n=1 Tax=Streptomyces sp. NPDC001843 TaxID=3364617 RepID=UPI0036D206CE
MRLRSAFVSAALALSMCVLSMGVADAAEPLSATKVREWQTGLVLDVTFNSTVGGASIIYKADSNDLSPHQALIGTMARLAGCANSYAIHSFDF